MAASERSIPACSLKLSHALILLAHATRKSEALEESLSKA